MFRTSTIVAVALFSLAAASAAQAGPIVNVQFGDSTTPLYVGTAALPSGTGTVWNLLTGGGLGGASLPSGSLENSFGGSSSVTYTATTDWGFANVTGNPFFLTSDYSNTGAPNLVNSQMGETPSGTGEILVSGLAAGHLYSLYLYSDRDVPSAYTIFTVTDAHGSQQLTAGNQSTLTTGFHTPEDYVAFTGLSPNGSNQIEIQFADPGYAGINGFQLVDTTPEPGTFLLFGMGTIGMFLMVRRRRGASAQQPARASLIGR